MKSLGVGNVDLGKDLAGNDHILLVERPGSDGDLQFVGHGFELFADFLFVDVASASGHWFPENLVPQPSRDCALGRSIPASALVSRGVDLVVRRLGEDDRENAVAIPPS
jgi:hypothetical protein